MRSISLQLCALLAFPLGCGVPREQYLARMLEVRRLESVQADQQAQISLLQEKLAEQDARLATLFQQRDALAQRMAELEAELVVQRQTTTELAHLNAELRSRQREYVRLSEEISSVWYSSALERARRAASPEAREKLTPLDASGAVTP